MSILRERNALDVSCLRRSAARLAIALSAIAVGAGTPLQTLPAQEIGRAQPTSVLPVTDAYPHVAPDGLVVFQTNRVGGSKLFVARLDDSELRQLTSGPGEDVTPVWSPDGSRQPRARGSDRDPAGEAAIRSVGHC